MFKGIRTMATEIHLTERRFQLIPMGIVKYT